MERTWCQYLFGSLKWCAVSPGHHLEPFNSFVFLPVSFVSAGRERDSTGAVYVAVGLMFTSEFWPCLLWSQWLFQGWTGDLEPWPRSNFRILWWLFENRLFSAINAKKIQASSCRSYCCGKPVWGRPKEREGELRNEVRPSSENKIRTARSCCACRVFAVLSSYISHSLGPLLVLILLTVTASTILSLLLHYFYFLFNG